MNVVNVYLIIKEKEEGIKGKIHTLKNQALHVCTTSMFAFRSMGANLLPTPMHMYITTMICSPYVLHQQA